MTDDKQMLPKLYLHDYFFKAVILPFVPEWVQPNQITALRLMLTPFVLWLLFLGRYEFGVPLFLIAAFTDALDGSLARVRNKITAWGIFFDPVADKLLIGSVALLVALQYFHPALVFMAIILDLVPAIRWSFTRHTGRIMMANWWGKTKMILQVTSISCLLIGVMFEQPGLILVGEWILGISLFFAVAADVTYSL